MAVSKRTRFEVLRRDDYTCRYCRSKENALTIDHVVPVALGGNDDPSNLVAACRDCNAGKSSATPDQALVSEVDADAVRWAQAMAAAAQKSAADRAARQALLDHFLINIWGQWTWGVDHHLFELGDDWEGAILRQLAAGLTMDDLDEAVSATMRQTWKVKNDHFRYFMGVCRTMLNERMDAAKALLAAGN
jgi:hypothetical protein